jgi:hypothetical protein
MSEKFGVSTKRSQQNKGHVGFGRVQTPLFFDHFPVEASTSSHPGFATIIMSIDQNAVNLLSKQGTKSHQEARTARNIKFCDFFASVLAPFPA